MIQTDPLSEERSLDMNFLKWAKAKMVREFKFQRETFMMKKKISSRQSQREKLKKRKQRG